MNKLSLSGLTLLMACSCVSLANANSVPKPTKNYKGNFETLTKDQKVPVKIATCLATAHDLVTKTSKHDRYGFTTDEIKKAKISYTSNKKTELISVKGTARDRRTVKWQDITVNCKLQNGKIIAINAKITK